MKIMFTVVQLLGIILLGVLIVAVANKLDNYMNRDSSLKND